MIYDSRLEASTHALPDALSIVIPTLDGAHWLEGCLASLRQGTDQPHEIIVADDGSTDGSHAVCDRFGATFVTTSRARTGFAATANRGIRQATGRWILLLNNDTEVPPTTITALRNAFVRYPDAAMIAPLVLSLRDRETVDSAGMLLFPDATARPRWHGDNAAQLELVEEEVLVPSGAAAVFRSDWLGRVGLLDEGMTSYLEDIDLGLRVRRRGGTAIFVPSAVVFHWFSGTTGALSPTKARLIERNHATVAARHLPLPLLIALPIWTAVRWAVLVRTVLGSRSTQQEGGAGPSVPLTAMAIIRGTLEGMARLPRAIRERRRLNVDDVLTRRQWRSLLHQHRAKVSDYRRFGA